MTPMSFPEKEMNFFLFVVFMILSKSAGQECEFLSINRPAIWKNESPCPCYESTTKSQDCQQDYHHHQQDPLSPLIECSYLPTEFIVCDLPYDHQGNESAKKITWLWLC